MNNCIDCGKEIDLRAKRCASCATSFRFRKIENIPAYIDGRYSTKHYCIECKINEISYTSWRRGSQRCLSCSKMGDKNNNFKHGKSTFQHFCIDCDKPIYWTSIRCKSCATSGKLSSRCGKISHGKWAQYEGIWFRSSYEVAYAKYLNRLNIKWLYEKGTFDLGNCTYTPDFYLPETDTFVEIKGYWRNDAKKKFKLFKKLYPELKIAILNKNILEKKHIITN